MLQIQKNLILPYCKSYQQHPNPRSFSADADNKQHLCLHSIGCVPASQGEVESICFFFFLNILFKNSGIHNTSTEMVTNQKWFAVWCSRFNLELCDNLVGWDGVEWGGRFKRETVSMADLCGCMAETNTTLSSNYPSIKNKSKEKKNWWNVTHLQKLLQIKNGQGFNSKQPLVSLIP